MSRLVLGIDIGVTSIGYGLIDLETGNFVDYGVRLFKEATAKNNEDRRNKRGSRRLISRRKNRLEDMRNLLKRLGVFSDDYKDLNNPYEIRCRGLEEKLNNQELTCALMHIVKHRGSSLEVAEGENNGNEKGTKVILSQNSLELKIDEYVCKVQLKRLKEQGTLRGIKNNFKTKDYIKEAEKLLSNQSIDEDGKKAIISLIERRRHFSEGPGSKKSPTLYGRFFYDEYGQLQEIDLIKKMRGKCSLYPDEYRAPKQSFSAELFNFLNDLNNLSIEGEKLTEKDKQNLINIILKKGNITVKGLAKELGVSLEKISGYRINTKRQPLLTEFKGYKVLKKIFDKAGKSELLMETMLLDDIISILVETKIIEERIERIRNLNSNFSNELLDDLANITTISGYHSLSFKAIRELNEEMLKTSMNQMQIIHQNKLYHQKIGKYKGRKNIECDENAILSPVAKRAQREAFKVINKIRKEYGELDSIVIEMTRAKNSKEEKDNIKNRQKRFEQENKEVDKLLLEANYDPDKINAKTKTKIRLYMQQNGKSAYCQNNLELPLIIRDPNAYEIDHIIPLSISLDDSLANKVLVTHLENQEKGNSTPVEAFLKAKFSKGSLEKYRAYVYTNNQFYGKKKDYLLYDKDITKYSNAKEFINRNLVDTSYACRVVLNTLTDYFRDNEIPTKVHTVKGQATSAFRKRIKLDKDRDLDYSHHAIDALIVASIKKLGLLNTLLSKYDLDDLYNSDTSEIIKVEDDEKYLDSKYIEYISNLKNVKVIKFSHKIDTKPNRKIADETIYSTRIIEGNERLIKKYPNIYDPKFNHLTEDILNGKEDKYLMKRHDYQTFEKIKVIILNHYEMFKNDSKYYSKKKNGEIELKGENPLTEYKEEHGFITKYSKKGNGPNITSIKYDSENLGNHISITDNYQITENNQKKVVLLQLSSYRSDIWLDKDKYKMVTVRYSDIKYNKSKNNYYIDQNWYKEQKEIKKISDEAVFIASFHHDELIGIVKKKGSACIDPGNENEHDGVNVEILKFTATNNDKENKIEVKPIDYYCSKQLMPSIGTFVKVEKYATDVLGNLYKVTNNHLKLEF